MDALASTLRIWRRRPLVRQVRIRLAPLAVYAAALAIALWLWTCYANNWRQLWTDVVHDRNAHLEYGLGCASDLIHFRIDELVRDIDRSRTWPPLYEGVMVASALLLGGMNPQLAVLPSALCFAGAALLAFLLARQICGRGGTVAGAVAAMLILVSPAMRAYAMDVMVEAPGAMFTLLALYAAVLVRQNDTPAAWRHLALALSALFFIKYNYWLLVVFALAPLWWQLIASLKPWQSCGSLPAIISRQVREPLNWLLAGLAIAAVWVKLSGSPMPLAMTALWWGVLARVALWHRRGGRVYLLQQPPLRALAQWHALPVAAWLAWPGKLASFVWVLWPGTNVGEFPAEDRWEGFAYYVQAVTQDYHVGVWSAVTVGILVAIALTAWLARQLKPGAVYVLCLLAIAALLTAPHPNRKSRFVHSWLPAAWVLAGVGAAALTRADKRLAISAGALFVALHVPALTAMPHAPEGGLQPQRPTALELTDAYLPYLTSARQPAVLCNVPMKFLARWTFLDRFGRGTRVLTEVPGFDPRTPSAANAAAFRQWLEATNCDVIVLVELPATSPWYVPVPNHAGLEQLIGLMNSQADFVLFYRHEMLDRGGAAVSVWRKAPG